MKRKVFRIFSCGGLGDILLGTPILSALKRENPGCKIILFCFMKRDLDVFRNNPHVDVLGHRSFITNPLLYTLYYYRRGRKFNALTYDQYFPSFVYRKSVTHIMADKFGVTLDSPRLEVYLTEKEKEWGRKRVAGIKNPVAIHVTSLCSKNQSWPLRNWEELIRSLPEYTFVQLGMPTEDKVEGAVDLRGKTSFREALSILNCSLSFVGVVSSFSHATSAFGTPGVVLFGASAPRAWGHSNNINLYKNLEC